MIPISYNVRSLFVRKATTIAAALGIALVVSVVAVALMLAAGIRKTMGTSGSPDNAIVLRKGSDTELASSLENRFVNLIFAAPGVKKDDTGAPLGVGEVTVVISQNKIGSDGQVSNIMVRGVPQNVMKLRREVRIIDGRPAQPGTDEVIIGKGVRGRFEGVELNGTFDLKKNRPVKVVGVFEAGGSSLESEVWCDVDTLRSSFGREGLVSSVTAKLESPSDFDAFETAVETDKQLGLEAMRESTYYEKASEGTSMFITGLGFTIAFFVSFGAMIGAMITMYAAVAQRQREIGTLQALGFSRSAVLFSFLLESIVLALVGGAIGLAVALVASTIEVPMMNFQTWQEVTFRFHATPGILIGSLVFGAVMGVLGGLFPAVRAARVSPIEAMRR